jgi:phosphatidylinositol-3-phosphatase
MITALTLAAAMALPQVSHVTIVVMENKNYATVVGDARAPYFNQRLLPKAMLLRNMHAVAHPSEPNYLALFSGSTHGVSGDPCPLSYSSPNLATRLSDAGLTFGGYSESMPHAGFDGCWTRDGLYARKHVPWVNFTNVPPSQNLVYAGLPSDPPTVMWITPNMCDDTHDCSTRTGDRWLEENLPPIMAWNERNQGLLILTWDEADPDEDGANRIPTVLAGPMIRSGTSDQKVDHYSLLRTVEMLLGLPCIDKECPAPALAGIWK